MNVLNFPEGQRPKTTETSPWYRVYRTAAWYKCFFWVSCEEIFTTKNAKGGRVATKEFRNRRINHKGPSAAKPQPKGRRDFTAETRSSQSSECILTKKLFTLRPPRLRGEPSENLRTPRKLSRIAVQRTQKRNRILSRQACPEPVEGRASALKIVADQPRADLR